jgi:hypothetical protein
MKKLLFIVLFIVLSTGAAYATHFEELDKSPEGAHKRKKKADNVVVGAELNVSVYFTGGFFMSFGCDWTMNMLEFKDKFFMMNPQTLHLFFPMSTSSYLHSICFILSAGYAFSN